MAKRVFLGALVVVAVVVGYVGLRPGVDGGAWVYGSGVVEATEVDVSAQVGGLLRAVEAREGQSVAAGGVIARIETEGLEAQLRQARGAVQAAEGDLARSQAARAGTRAARETAHLAYEKSTELKGRRSQAAAQHEAALAARDQAKARLELVRAGAREEEIRQARAGAESAEAEWENARLELARRETLLGQGAVSQQQVDFQRTAEKAARARLEEVVAGARTEEERQAEAALAQAEANVLAARRALETAEELYADKLELKQGLDLAEAEEQAAQEATAAAAGRLESARGALAGAEKRLRDAVVTAPLDATVLLKIREPGETVAPGQPIVRLADLDHMWLRVYVAETEINRVKLGQKAEVTIDAAPGRTFAGEVTEIAQEAEFTPKNVQTREQRVKLVFGVKVGLANPEGVLKPGMPAEARISVGARSDDD